jgi:hypothetical protein
MYTIQSLFKNLKHKSLKIRKYLHPLQIFKIKFHKFFDVVLLKIIFNDFIISYIFFIKGAGGEGGALFSGWI